MDSKALASQIADFDSKRVTSVDAMNEAAAQFGLPEIRKNVAGMRTTIANTQNSLNAVDPSVTGRTQGSLVTEAQRQRQVANERAPIAGQLEQQTGAYGTLSGDLKDAESNANMLATSRVNDWQAGRQALQSRYDMTKQAEDDSLARQVAAEQARRQQSNADRDYQLQVQAAARSGSSTKAPSAAEQKMAVASHVVDSFNKLKGRDGYVSNETWANALNDFTAAGGTPRDFFKNYSQYVNPKYKTSYAGWVNR